jgi:hypothetical protein
MVDNAIASGDDLVSPIANTILNFFFEISMYSKEKFLEEINLSRKDK